ncbi:MAG: hypothetical protein Q9226_008661 [Calogaya cf. arnoldii]
MEPHRATRTDNQPRQAYRETRFEDFMGKDSPLPSLPPLPANVAGLASPRIPTDARLSRPFDIPKFQEPVDEDARPGTASTAALSVAGSQAQTWLRYDRKHGDSGQVHSTDTPLFPRRNQDQQIQYSPCQTCRRQVHPSTAFSYNGTYLCEDCAATGPWGKKKKEKLSVKKNKVSRKPVPTPTGTTFKEKYTPAATLSISSTLRALSPKPSPRQPYTDLSPVSDYGYFQYSKPSSPAPSSSPHSPFATPNPEGKYPRYRTPPPPPPPMRTAPPPPITTTNLPFDQAFFSPPASPLRKPKPASSIYPSSPWRLSHAPSIPDIPEKYMYQEPEKVNTWDNRDTVYRAEMEEDIIDSYAVVNSPVSPLSDKDVEKLGDMYVNAGWRTRKHMS